MNFDQTKLNDTLSSIEGLLDELDQASTEINESLELLRVRTAQAHESFSTIDHHVKEAKKASATKLLNLTKQID